MSDTPPETPESYSFSRDGLPSFSMSFELHGDEAQALFKMFGPRFTQEILLSHVPIYMGLDFATGDPLFKYGIGRDFICVITQAMFNELQIYAKAICPPDRYRTYGLHEITGRQTFVVPERDEPWCYMQRDYAKATYPHLFSGDPDAPHTP